MKYICRAISYGNHELSYTVHRTIAPLTKSPQTANESKQDHIQIDDAHIMKGDIFFGIHNSNGTPYIKDYQLTQLKLQQGPAPTPVKIVFAACSAGGILGWQNAVRDWGWYHDLKEFCLLLEMCHARYRASI